MPEITNQRFQEMDEHGKRLQPEVDKLWALLAKYIVIQNTDFYNYFMEYLADKLKKKPLRAYFALKVYHYFNQYPIWQQQFAVYPKELFLTKLPFVFEVIITIQYLHNHILDEKYETKKSNFPRINQNLIASNILKELLYKYISAEIKPLLNSSQKYLLFKNRISDLFIRVDIGQYLDKEYNHYEAWKSADRFNKLRGSAVFDPIAIEAISAVFESVISKVSNKRAFIETYFQRIYCTNVYFFRCIVEVIVIFTGLDENSHAKRMNLFSIQYGFMLQIINDYADFAYTDDPKERARLKIAGKKTTDVFADLYNKNITLPLIFHINEGYKRKIEAYLEGSKKNRTLLDLYPNQIKQEITDSGAIYECISISRQLAESAIHHLDKHNPISDILSDMCAMAFNNKFYKVFRP